MVKKSHSGQGRWVLNQISALRQALLVCCSSASHVITKVPRVMWSAERPSLPTVAGHPMTPPTGSRADEVMEG